jgi:hydrogenase-4 component E
MFVRIFPNLVNLLSFIVLGLTFVLLLRKELAAQVRMFAAQSYVLGVLGIVIAAFAGRLELFGVALAVVIVKGWFIPRVLNRAVSKIGLQRAAAPYLSTPAMLTVCGALVVVAFFIMQPVSASNPLPTADSIPLAFAGVLIGFFVTVVRRRALTQILGFLMLENGIFLLALLATYGVPFIVELGVFLDVLVAVLIMEVFIYRIKQNFDSIEVDQLGTLRG